MIKSIYIDNFKAFANPTTIDFSEGTTGIIGPNGSGKSNIIDAIRWVMGETSSKNLRGEKMEDVIFNGTEKIKQEDYAEVNMVLDNTNGFFSDSLGTEVKVGRSVIRAKGSEYSINDQECRLKDLQNLFMDSGIGSRSYSMISQGEVRKILSANKDERRSVFEEAAGIVKLKMNKKKTEEKLSEVEQNLLRYSDIIAEIKKQLEPLRKQSEKAQKFQLVHDELTTLEIQYLVQEYDQQKQLLKQIHSQLFEEQTYLQTYVEDLHSLESKLEQHKQSQEIHEQELFLIQDELVQAKEKLEKENSSLSIIEEKIQHTNEKLSTIIHSLKEFEDKFSISADDYATRQHYLADLKQVKINMNQESIQLVETISELENSLSSLRANLEISKDDSIHNYNDLNQRKERNEQLQKERLRLQDDKNQLSEKRFQMEENLQDLDFQIEQKQNEKEMALSMIHQNKQTMVHLEQQLHNFISNKGKFESDISRSNEDKIKAESEIEHLTQLVENNDGFFEGVKFILNESKKGHLKGVHGAVGSLLKMGEKYESAIEQLLQGSLQFIITEDEQVAKHAVELLKQNQKGRATFRPLSLAKESSFRPNELQAIQSSNGIQKAIDVVQFDPLFHSVMHSLLGRSLIADNLDIAIHFSKTYSFPIKIVTLDGDIVDASSISGGYSKSKNNSIISKKRLLEKAKSRLEQLKNEYELKKNQLQALDKEIESTSNQKQTLQDSTLSLEYSIKDSDNEISYLIKEKERIQDAMASIELEKEGIEETLHTYSQESDVLRSAIQQMERKNNQLQTELSQLHKTIQEKEKLFADSNEKKTTLLIEESRISEEIRQLEQLLNDVHSNNNDAKQKFELLANQKFELEQAIQQLYDDKKQSELNITSHTQETHTLETTLKNKKDSNSYDKNTIKETEKTIQSIRNEKEKYEKMVHNSEVKQEKITGILNSHISRLWEGYEMEESKIGSIERVSINLEESQTKIKQLKNQISSLGSINHNAITEYIELKQRFDEEQKQWNDMEAAKKDLKNMLNDVYQEMLSRFNTSFEEIASIFTELFKSFFGGGKAKIELEDPKNPLDSPIIIRAAPPGKIPNTINSLSGGEQTLTAIALIFSILKTKPSPFVILDEIDAPLDDANIIRFTDHLVEFSKETQFIIITHRLQTMKVLNFLYGVSQVENGVSLVLPCSFDEVKASFK